MEKRLVVLVVVLSSILGAILWKLSAPAPTPRIEAPSAPAAPQARVGILPVGGRSEAEVLAGRQKRDALLRALRDAETRAQAAAMGHDLAGAPTLEASYAQARVDELSPFFRACYEDALRSTPRLRGRVAVRLVVTGDPAIGGIVEHAALVRGTGPDAGEEVRSALDDCIQSTAESLTFPPPANAGRAELTHVYLFSED